MNIKFITFILILFLLNANQNFVSLKVNSCIEIITILFLILYVFLIFFFCLFCEEIIESN